MLPSVIIVKPANKLIKASICLTNNHTKWVPLFGILFLANSSTTALHALWPPQASSGWTWAEVTLLAWVGCPALTWVWEARAGHPLVWLMVVLQDGKPPDSSGVAAFHFSPSDLMRYQSWSLGYTQSLMILRHLLSDMHSTLPWPWPASTGIGWLVNTPSPRPGSWAPIEFKGSASHLSLPLFHVLSVSPAFI